MASPSKFAHVVFNTHRYEEMIAFLNLGPAPEDLPPRRVNHLAYTWRTLGELVDPYKRLKADGIRPVRPIRHGPTLSLYYADPDGNHLEFQIDVLEAEAANRFMRGPAFEANPIGEPFDPDELVARFEAGAPVDQLVFRSDQAPAPLAVP
jgi:hypothetical protein